MDNCQVGEIVYSAGVGGEHPQGLEPIVALDVSAARRARLGGHVNQHAAVRWFSDRPQSIGNRPTAAVDDLASDLIRGPGILRRSPIRTGLGKLSRFDCHHRCHRSQIGGDWNPLL